MTQNKQVQYDLQLIKNWQRQLHYTDDQVQAVIQVDDYSTFINGHAAVGEYDPAADRFRKVAFKKLMPNLDMRSAYLLNGIKFEIHDLALTPTKVQLITGVSTEEYDHFLAGESDRLVYENAFDRMGAYYYQQVGNRLG
ncbi:hypothetical protein [Lentilactobacillus hilgardii]|uniref:hypothetical protein n=1 Tax=Lentilactobacillus hilgardii TaxID=1588 RepID=UPI0021C2577B|nr:hypothetical protein [Lentilactobacillus hilgardii]MCP9334087.1 hypothetical protein [Lentilactobacillus hilgardii]MCP9350708.1 hypothetical protein [Lentilactobacillus hilgardii]MCP9353564.1 hypothetical protein [Lentilactobacillus hilgardii]